MRIWTGFVHLDGLVSGMFILNSRKFHDQLSNYHLLKEDLSQWSLLTTNMKFLITAQSIQ
jgi:hypothetical protein